MASELFGERSARYNPADPYFPFRPRGFESYTIRRWRAGLEDGHMAAEGVHV